MTITADEIYKLNKMNATASSVQLGTLIQNAESVVAGDIALAEGKLFVGNGSGVAEATTLTSAQILVGNAASVATPVSVTGDVTISNAGVTAIASDVIVNADVKTDAAIAFSKLAALTSGNILVGSAGNVATSVAMSGDATIVAAGTLTIANSAVTAAKISDTSGAKKLTVATVTAANLVAAGSGVAVLAGVAIPDNAIITRTFYEVTTTFAGNGDDASTIKIGIEDQDDDTVASIAISNGGNPWDAGLHEGIQDGAMANALKLSAARQVAVKWTIGGTDTTLNAGSMMIFVEWVQGG